VALAKAVPSLHSAPRIRNDHGIFVFQSRIALTMSLTLNDLHDDRAAGVSGTPRLHVRLLRSAEELAGLGTAWNRLSRGIPFRSSEWLQSWWRHYGPTPAHVSNRRSANDIFPGGHPKAQLFTLAVFDSSDELVGLAPWYIESSLLAGRVIRFLGDGEVCSDYQDILCRADLQDEVAAALATWLMSDSPTVSEWLSQENERRWDLLQLTGVDAQDSVVRRLAEELAARGAPLHVRPGATCWRIELPETWDEYLAGLSKGHRKQVRQFERRMFDTGRAVWHTAVSPADLVWGWKILTDLHQRRRQSLGQPGRFGSPRFAAFHREVADRLLLTGMLRLHWLEIDSRPVAAEYHLAGPKVSLDANERPIAFAYQSGVEPEALADEPGRLATIASIRGAMADGFGGLDLLRGDEAYKAHWRAMPRPSIEYRIWRGKATNWLRHGIWTAGQRVKRWLKPSTGCSASTSAGGLATNEEVSAVPVTHSH
jgi:CelD/BcsL family acetyltransferase involved in cellulose biosynthesis